MELTFKTEKKKNNFNYLRFLPKSLRFTGLLSIIFNTISVLVVLAFYAQLQKEIPLFYSLPSDQQLASKEFIFILPALATLINLIHFLIAYLEREINYNILRMFLKITLFVQVLLLAITLRIIIIVY